MATRQPGTSDGPSNGTGLNHLTVVPENFDPSEAACSECGRPLDEH